jgi:aminoglycoside phosphotransferase (APT) family kinase protein
LTGATEELSGPLILRVHSEKTPPSQCLFEASVHNAVVNEGYPAPRVHLTCADSDVLGGVFMIMERMPGVPMLEMKENLPEALAEAHISLHHIDPNPLVRQLESVGITKPIYSRDGTLSWVRKLIDDQGFDWLDGGFQWLWDGIPPDPVDPVICHGDFHPLNILMEGDRVSGVLDWPGFRVWDAAYDVACTKVICAQAAPPLLPDLGLDFREFTDRYFHLYQLKNPLTSEKVEYYEAYRCFRGILEGRRGHLALSHPKIQMNFSDRFEEVTGIEIKLPS